MQKIATFIVTVAACAALAYFFWIPDSSHEEEDDHDHHDHNFVEFSSDKIQQYHVELKNASPGLLKREIKAPAHLAIIPDRQAHVFPKVSGIAVSVNKHLGEFVEEGDLLAVMESKEMAEAKAAYLTALKKEQLMSITLERETNLYEKKLASAQDYHNAAQQWEEATIDLELSQQRLQTMGIDIGDIAQITRAEPELLRRYELRTPISGQIIERHITPGELVSTDQETYEIADLDRIWAEIHIFPQDRSFAKLGQPVELVSFDGKTTQAQIVYLSPVINAITHTSTAIAEVDNSTGEWFPGTFVQATLIADQIPVALSVPKEAVQEIDGTPSLFIATDEGFDVRPVTLGRSDNHSYEITEGLQPGDAYAYTNTFLLKAELEKDEAEHMD